MTFPPYWCSILVRITIRATRRVDFLTDRYFFFLLLSSPCDFRFVSDMIPDYRDGRRGYLLTRDLELLVLLLTTSTRRTRIIMTDLIDSMLDLMRRLPPPRTEENVAALVGICPEDADELLQSVDQPLQVKVDRATGREYLACDYNRDEASYRYVYIPSRTDHDMLIALSHLWLIDL